MYAQADAQRLLPKPKAMLPGKPGQSAKQPLARPTFPMQGSMQPASHGAIARVHAFNKANPSPDFTPKQAAAAAHMYERNNPLGLLGDHAEKFLQLKQIAQQGAHSFDPRTVGGALNAAALFYGGPGEDTTSLMNREMPGQFEKFSIAKSSAGGHLGTDQMTQAVAHDAWVARNHPNAEVRMEALQRLHDQLFGGEVHAKGEIPTRPNDQTMAKLNENRAQVRAQLRQERLDAFNRRAADRQQQQPSYDAAARHNEALTNFFHRNNIRAYGDAGRGTHAAASQLLWDHLGRGVDHPDFAGEHPARFPMNLNKMGQPEHDAAGLLARRQEVLQRYYRQQLHNHQN